MKKQRKNSIIYSSLILTIFIIIIKVLGLLKHTIISKYIGANIETDAFYISTGVMGHISILLFSSLSITLLSMYSNKKEREDNESSSKLISSAYIFFIPFSIILSIICYILSPYISKFLAPSYKGEELSLLIKNIRILSFSFIPCCYYLIGNVVLENEQKFISGRFKDFFQHLFVIASAVLLYRHYGMISLVYSFFFASVIQAIIIFVRTKKYYKFNFIKNINRNEIKKLLILSFPILIGNAVYEINDIVDKQISSGLKHGYTTLLTYGATLNEIVTGVIINSISVVFFANLTTYVAKNDYEEIQYKLIKVMNILVLLLVPLMSLFIVLGYDITSLFFGNGKLSNYSLNKIYYVLIGYSLGFIFQAFRANFVKVLYAFQKNKKTMYNGIITISINIILSIILSKIIGLWGISLATSISMLFSSIFLYFDIKKVLPSLKFNLLTEDYYKYIISGITTFFFAYMLRLILDYNAIMNIIIIFPISLIIYLLMIIILKCKVINEFKNKLKHTN